MGWHAANFGRAKTLDNLETYLNTPTPQDRRRGLLDMFRRIRGKQEGDHGRSE